MELAVQLEAYAAGRAVMIMTDKQLDELYELAYLLQKKDGKIPNVGIFVIAVKR